MGMGDALGVTFERVTATHDYIATPVGVSLFRSRAVP
jgi:hypothetical protein